MRTAGYVFGQVRALVDDVEGDWASDEYLTPLLQLACDDLQAFCLRDPNIGEVKAFVVLPSVAAGTTSLAPYFGTGQPLEALESPMAVREKIAGSQDIQYLTMTPTETPVPVTSNYGSYNLFYTWTGTDILLPGANQALDMWIYGAFRQASIANKETPLAPMTENMLTYATLEHVAFRRGNATKERSANAKLLAARSAYMRELYKIQQRIPVRCLPYRGSRSYSNGTLY